MTSNYNMFSNKLKESIYDNEFYGKIQRIEIENFQQANENLRSYKIQISLMTNLMIRADTYFFTRILDLPELSNSLDEITPFTPQEEEIFKGYHPYVYEFTAESTDYDLRSSLNEYSGQWIKMRNDDGNTTANDIRIQGTEIFSASPLVASGKSIIFNRCSKFDSNCVLLDKIFKKDNLKFFTYNCDQLYNYKKFTDLLSSSIKQILGTVYSVGLANNIKLELVESTSHSCTILYDIGCTHIADILHKKDVSSNLKSFYTENFDAIVLSHWDFDHIAAIGYYNPTLLYSPNMVWVAPDINDINEKKLTISAVRLACYVANKSNLYLSHNYNMCLNTKNKFLQLWQGKGTGAKQATHQNNIGLLIELNHFDYLHIRTNKYNSVVCCSNYNKIHALLTGDVVFDNIPDNLKNNNLYDLLVTPHHGTNRTIPDINGTGRSAAIVCADKSGTSEHYPGPDHIIGLIRNGFKNIYITGEDSNIYFEMIL